MFLVAWLRVEYGKLNKVVVTSPAVFSLAFQSLMYDETWVITEYHGVSLSEQWTTGFIFSHGTLPYMQYRPYM